jgi:hypothetical protein
VPHKSQRHLIIIYDISLTSSAFLTAEITTLSTTSLSINDPHYHFHRQMYNRLLVQCHLVPPDLTTQTITYMLSILLMLVSKNLTYRHSWHSRFQISCPFSVSLVVPNNPSKSGSFYRFRNMLVYLQCGDACLHRTSKTEVRPPFACPKYLFN